MTEKEKVEYTKSFIDQMANGINPINNEKIPDEDLLNNPRIIRCMFYVSEILKNEIERLEEIEEKEKKVSYPSKQPKNQKMQLSQEVLASFIFSKEPVYGSKITDSLNALNVDPCAITLKVEYLTAWLTEIGLIESSHRLDGTLVRKPTPEGEILGIQEVQRLTNGKSYAVIYYNEDAQHFIIDNFDAFSSYAYSYYSDKKELKKKVKWTDELRSSVCKMFSEEHLRVDEISEKVKIQPYVIRKELKKLGLLES